jgi:ABC-type lipoprotein export system ATPase subunit
MKGTAPPAVGGAEEGPLIELSGVGFVVDSPVRTRILHPISLEIAARASVAIVGPSGAGKTTLASIIGALQQPSEGSYRFAGDEVVGMPARRSAELRSSQIGFVFQNSHLIDERSAIANIALGIADQTMPRDERVNACRQALDLVGLSDIAERKAALLSGGERHRVAIARALVKAPRLVIADEPTAALDQATGQAILELLSELPAHGATLLVVSHDSRAKALASQVVSIVDGRVA